MLSGKLGWLEPEAPRRWTKGCWKFTTDGPLPGQSADELCWTGPPDPVAFAELCVRLGAPGLATRAQELAPHRR